MIRAARHFLALALAAAATPAQSGDLRFRTELGISQARSDLSSLATALGYSDVSNTTAGFRAMWTQAAGPLRFEAHAILAAVQGDAVAYGTALAPYLPPPVPFTLFDLTHTSMPDAETVRIAALDRASVAFSGDHLVVKIGRQAITWGGGLVFHPTDIVAPFSPSSIDTAYKPGADMVYGQYLFDGGADIQAIALPRPATPGGPIDPDQSTFAVLASASLGAIDARLMAARDRTDAVVGLGASGPLGGASWTVEIVDWRLTGGDADRSWIFNITTFGRLGSWNASYFAEAFHNGFGVDGSVPLDALPAALTKRMSTGQVFYAGRDFLALGAQIQTSPALSVAPSAIISLNDGSVLVSAQINYSLGDNTDLSLSVFQPIGAEGSAFGGRETSVGSGEYFGPARAADLRVVHFF